MKKSTKIAIFTIRNNLALHLFGAIEAHEPINIINQMQHLCAEKTRFREYLLVRVQTPGKDCITARRAWPTLTLLEGNSNTCTLTPAAKKWSTSASVEAGNWGKQKSRGLGTENSQKGKMSLKVPHEPGDYSFVA